MKELEKIANRLESLEQELLEVKSKLNIEPKLKYPIYKKHINLDLIVKFTDIKEGEVIKGWHTYKVGKKLSNWESHKNTDLWEDVVFNEERGLYDKQLVWCWNDDTHSRALRFYDGINNGSFCSWGERSSIIYWDNIEPYEGDYPKWAKEAYKTLED